MAFPFTDMTQEQIETFLRAPRFATVATIRRGGSPQLTPMWYLYENGKFFLSMHASSAKYHNLSRDPRISLCVTGDCPDARSVMVYGSAELFLRGNEDWVGEFSWRLTRRYCDSDEEASSLTESDEGEPEAALAVVTVEKMIAQDYNS